MLQTAPLGLALAQSGSIVKHVACVGPCLLSQFWPAEDYHQDYYKKNPNRYLYYKTACGRAARLEQIWGPPAKPPSVTQ